MELGPHGIRVNAICPGSIKGSRIDGVIERDASLRQFVDAGDVANTVYLRASPQAA